MTIPANRKRLAAVALFVIAAVPTPGARGREPAPAAETGGVHLLDETTPWRAHLVTGPGLLRQNGRLVVQGRRASSPFDPADGARAMGVKVTIACVGGAVVYVNGEEVGRGAFPPGPLRPLTPADDYPPAVYTTDDGVTPLPNVASLSEADAKWSRRYRDRVRSFTVAVPPRAWVKGRNVLAVEVHRSAVCGPLPRDQRSCGWGHLGLCGVSAGSPGAEGVVPYAAAAKAARLWSAAPEEQVTSTPPEQSPANKIKGWIRLNVVRGTYMGNCFDPVLPIRMVVPRNGVCSGQVVLSDAAGLKGVAATLGQLKGPDGAAIGRGAVQIRYAVQHRHIHYCDALMEAAPAGAATVPVWLVIETPPDQAPGWYVATLSVAAGGRTFTVHLRGGPCLSSWFGGMNAVSVPGPKGAIPTVRFQMLREGIQDAQVRTAMVRAYLKLPQEKRRRYQVLLDEFATYASFRSVHPLRAEPGHNWPAYVARVHEAAAGLAGAKPAAAWNSPPMAP